MLSTQYSMLNKSKHGDLKDWLIVILFFLFIWFWAMYEAEKAHRALDNMTTAQQDLLIQKNEGKCKNGFGLNDC
ncbi:MAG: hypothetical protein KKA19_06790 [Candidatus Margulisbacteria bacterium]|nr:hypothetical protein [Candidatus Margulisiibacteriota bacterium]